MKTEEEAETKTEEEAETWTWRAPPDPSWTPPPSLLSSSACSSPPPPPAPAPPYPLPPPPPPPPSRLPQLQSDYASLSDINIRHERRIHSLHSRLTQLIGFFLLFHGMLFTSISQANMLRCHNWWLPFSLSSIASFAIILPILRLLLTLSRSHSELDQNRADADRLLRLIMAQRFLTLPRPPSPLQGRFPPSAAQGLVVIGDDPAAVHLHRPSRDSSMQAQSLHRADVEMGSVSSHPCSDSRWHAGSAAFLDESRRDLVTRFGGDDVDLPQSMDPATTFVDRFFRYLYSCGVLLVLLSITTFVLFSCRWVLCNRT